MGGAELFGREERESVMEVMRTGMLFRYGFQNKRNGVSKVRRFEEVFSGYLGCKYALGVSSGTAALKLALLASKVGRGDEVIAPTFTFVATIEAIAETGAKVVFADIDKSLNIDPKDVVKKITDKTRAIVPVHMLGVSANMDEIMKIAKKNNLVVIEDNAQSCGGSYKGRKLGTLGDIGIFSFDHAKMITTGEGGILVTNNKQLYKKAEAYHDHGHAHDMNVERGLDRRIGQGFNFRMNELQGALGLAQLSKLEYMIEKQRQNKKKIKQGVKQQIRGLTYRDIPNPDGEIASFLVLYLPSKDSAEAVKKAISKKKIPVATLNYWHYFYNMRNTKNPQRKFPQSEDLLNRSLVFPISVNMSTERINAIISAINGTSKST